MSRKRSDSSLKLEYREITKADVPQLKAIHNASFPILYTDDFYSSFFENPHRHTILAATPSTNAQGYEVIGAVTWRIKKRTQSFQRITEWWNGFTSGTHAYIMTLAVAPEHRKKGVGNMLLAKTLEQMRNCDVSQVSLHMLTTNQAALHLYSNYGFSVICSLKGYYEFSNRTEDAYWMRKDMRKPITRIEAPVIAPRVRAGPWPFGMIFETFIMFVMCAIGLLSLLLATQWRKSSN